jgi:uncharacterized phage protein gp47/JayE
LSGTLTATAPYVDATGIHAPTYSDVFTYLQTSYRAIYGTDVYLGNDSQDGQLLGIFALALSDANAAAVAVYNSYSPATAQGVGLSIAVKINGISRSEPSNSQVDLLIVGAAGTQIQNGTASDPDGNHVWNLPAFVAIPPAGQVTVSATADEAGAVPADPGTITKIGNPTRGWQSVTNPTAATPGAPVETDGQLRLRQAASTMQPSVTALQGMVGAIETLSGVLEVRAYENDTSQTDTNGVPDHSLALVINGGDSNAIATTILQRKTPGAGTFGTTSVSVLDAFGVPNTIRFFRPSLVTIVASIKITPLVGYTTSIGNAIVTAVVNYITAIGIGNDVVLSKLYVPANLSGAAASTFRIVSILLARGNGGVTAGAGGGGGGGTTGSTGALAAQDVTIAFTERATTSTASVSVVIG